jgi:N-acetyl-gamma-glutamyl-phosphate reductase
MTAKVFIDGEAGTTGLQIFDRLNARTDIDLIRLDDTRRKDASARRDALNAADVAILCLPDDAAREAVALVENPTTCIIDASTAHRAADGWVYGFPEYADAFRRFRWRQVIDQSV